MIKKFVSLGAFALLLFSLQSSALAGKQSAPTVSSPRGSYKKGDIIIKYKTTNMATQDKVAALVGTDTSKKKLSKSGIYLLQSKSLKSKIEQNTPNQASVKTQTSSIPLDADTQAVLETLRKDPNVLYAEPNYAQSVQFTPNDTRFSEQYDFNNTGQTGGTVDADIDAPEAWDTTQGNASVVVAVIDTGVSINHPDLDSNIYRDPSGNVVGYDFVNLDADPDDDFGHGTHCAGTIAAETNNALGVAGVCPNCKIMPIKFLDSSGSGWTDDAILSFQFAIDHGAEVISNSWGGGSYEQALQDIITEAHNQGIIVVFAAGNSNTSDPDWGLPASMDNVIAVAATDNKDMKADFSSYDDGSGWVDVSAPGVDVLSTVPTGTCELCDASGYALLSGTSMATPHVAGLFGLLRSQKPAASIDSLETQLLMTADDIDSVNPGYEGLLGSGRINANAALVTVPGPKITYKSTSINDPSPAGNGDGFIQPGETISLNTQLRNSWGDASNVTVTLSTSDSYITITKNTASITSFNGGTTQTPNFTFNYASNGPINHTIDFILSITASGGYTTTLNFSADALTPVTTPITWNFADAQGWKGQGFWYLSSSDCFPSSNGNIAPYWFFGAPSCQPPEEMTESSLYSPPIKGTSISATNNAPIKLKILHTERCEYCLFNVLIKPFGQNDNTATQIGSSTSYDNNKAWETSTFIIPSGLYQLPYYQIIIKAYGGYYPIGMGIDNVSIVKDNFKITGSVYAYGSTTPLGDADIILDKVVTGVKSASDGSFALANVAPGTHTINASKTSYRQSPDQTLVVPSTGTITTTIPLTYMANGSISGKVVNDTGLAVSGATVLVSSTADVTTTFTATTSTSGNYNFTSLPSGQYIISAEKNIVQGSQSKKASFYNSLPITVTGGQTSNPSDIHLFFDTVNVSMVPSSGVVGSPVEAVYTSTVPLQNPTISTYDVEGQYLFIKDDFTYSPADMECSFRSSETDTSSSLGCSLYDSAPVYLNIPFTPKQSGAMTFPISTSWFDDSFDMSYAIDVTYNLSIVNPSTTPTPSKTFTATKTPTTTKTSTSTKSPSATSTPSKTFTVTKTPSATSTPTKTRTRVPTITPISFTSPATSTPTKTATPTVTQIPKTSTPSKTATPSRTKQPTITNTPKKTATPTKTKTPTITQTPSKTATPSTTSTQTPTPNGSGNPQNFFVGASAIIQL